MPISESNSAHYAQRMRRMMAIRLPAEEVAPRGTPGTCAGSTMRPAACRNAKVFHAETTVQGDLKSDQDVCCRSCRVRIRQPATAVRANMEPAQEALAVHAPTCCRGTLKAFSAQGRSVPRLRD
eukprot:3913227-Rhodomonas_salina.2